MNIRQLHPYLPFRTRQNLPVLVVLHATKGSTARSSIYHLRGVGLSYHYIISRDGNDTSQSESALDTEPIIYQCVPDLGYAFHVGSTIPAPGGFSINRASIGISLANIQRKQKPESYPTKQIGALHELLSHLKQAVPSIQFLTTHAVVQPWNRTDPLNIIGQEIAEKHGLAWWKPTEEEVTLHRPKEKK